MNKKILYLITTIIALTIVTLVMSPKAPSEPLQTEIHSGALPSDGLVASTPQKPAAAQAMPQATGTTIAPSTTSADTAAVTPPEAPNAAMGGSDDIPAGAEVAPAPAAAAPTTPAPATPAVAAPAPAAEGQR